MVQCGWVRVAGGAPWEVRAGGGGVWVVRVGSDEGVDGASVVARARERRHVRVGGGAIADAVVGLDRDLADQPGAHVLDGVP